MSIENETQSQEEEVLSRAEMIRNRNAFYVCIQQSIGELHQVVRYNNQDRVVESVGIEVEEFLIDSDYLTDGIVVHLKATDLQADIVELPKIFLENPELKMAIDKKMDHFFEALKTR
jgi:hypothetical protein